MITAPTKEYSRTHRVAMFAMLSPRRRRRYHVAPPKGTEKAPNCSNLQNHVEVLAGELYGDNDIIKRFKRFLQ
jgi:hypothetical protein